MKFLAYYMIVISSVLSIGCVLDKERTVSKKIIALIVYVPMLIVSLAYTMLN